MKDVGVYLHVCCCLCYSCLCILLPNLASLCSVDSAALLVGILRSLVGLDLVSLSPDLPTSRSTGCIASPARGDAIHPVLREVGRSGDSETRLDYISAESLLGCSTKK